MKTILRTLPVTILTLFVSGCGDSQPKTPPPAPTVDTTPNRTSSSPTPSTNGVSSANTQPAGSAPPPAHPLSPQREPAALGGTVHPFMTQQLRLFIQDQGRLPKDFAELAHERLPELLESTSGAEYVIDAPNQQVRIVRRSP